MDEAQRYNPEAIEARIQQQWRQDQTFAVTEDPERDKYYILDMFPYPSGNGLHLGHMRGYTASDVHARMKHMQGYNVLHPMGWDAFGEPAEEYALKHGIHPREAVEENVATFKEQLGRMGFNYDWGREINSTDPDYVRGTQLGFLKMWNEGLVYKSDIPINWCDSCESTKSNEDVVDCKCEQCKGDIRRVPIEQYKIKITEYADVLIDDLDELDGWGDWLKDMQRNWIGRSYGAEIHFGVTAEGQELDDLTVFTTMPETVMGTTFMAISPEHPIIGSLLDSLSNRAEVEEYVNKSINTQMIDRKQNKDKTGVPLDGVTIRNPLTGQDMPIYVADYVLPEYGTGAVMGVPAHDERDSEFAEMFGIPSIKVLDEETGRLINSGFLDGVSLEDAKSATIQALRERGFGDSAVSYKLADWVFARQRFWGEPIPLVHCDDCGTVPVPVDQLPLLLPDVENYSQTGTFESPLAQIHDWVHTNCPDCGGEAKRETDTMPSWAGSSWYWLRYMDPDNTEGIVDPDKEKYWGSVDMYVGGKEHSTTHMIYARFWNKVLKNAGVVTVNEPFQNFQHVGLVLGSDGKKMSKRDKNGANPLEVADEYGADSLRVYEMFMGDFSQPTKWDLNGIKGVHKFLERVWKIREKVSASKGSAANDLERSQLIEQVTRDISRFKFNTAVSALMVFSNQLQSQEEVSQVDYEALIKLLSPFAPHLTDELWQDLGNEGSLYDVEWPQSEETQRVPSLLPLVVMVDGKKVDVLKIDPNTPEVEIAEQIRNSVPRIAEIAFLSTIYKPGKIFNFVTK